MPCIQCTYTYTVIETPRSLLVRVPATNRPQPRHYQQRKRTGALDLNRGPSAASSGTALTTAAFSAALAAASTGALTAAKPLAAPFAFVFAGSGMSFGTDSCNHRISKLVSQSAAAAAAAAAAVHVSIVSCSPAAMPRPLGTDGDPCESTRVGRPARMNLHRSSGA